MTDELYQYELDWLCRNLINIQDRFEADNSKTLYARFHYYESDGDNHPNESMYADIPIEHADLREEHEVVAY